MHPLLLVLDLEFKGLEKVKIAVEKRDTSRALTELVTYFRNRIEPDPALLAQANAEAVESAQKAMRHEFVFYNEPGTMPGNGMDWTWKPGIDREWTWALNRHGWWPTLTSAYLATGDECYMQELDMLIRTWVGGHPPTTDDYSCWRTIEAGIRTMGPWPAILAAMKKSHSISQDAWLYYLRSIHDHAEFLLAHPKSGNWLLMETNGVLTCGLVFPEFKRAQDWVKIAIDKFEAEMQRQVHPDGAQIEYSTSYQFVCIHNFEAVLDKTDRASGHKFSQAYRDRLISMYEHVMYFMRPDGKLPMLNDADQHAIIPQLIRASEKFNRPDFLYVATHGKKGTPPIHLSRRFPYAKRAIMRSGWDEQAFYAMFEAAPFGYGHQHEDALTFELMAFNQPLVGTMGRYTYADVPERRYLTSSRGHNVVLIDGHGQNQRSLRTENRMNPLWIAAAPTDDPWISTDSLDVAYGRYDGPWSGDLQVTWERWLAFHKPDNKKNRPGFWVVRDRFSGTGEHTLDFLLHFYPGNLSCKNSQIATDYGPGKTNMLVHFPDIKGLNLDAAQGQKDPPRGWFSEEYGKIAPAWDVVATRRVAFPFTHDMVFVPFKDKVPDVQVTEQKTGVEAVINGTSYSVNFQ
jgi:hypothetical protein